MDVMKHRIAGLLFGLLAVLCAGSPGVRATAMQTPSTRQGGGVASAATEGDFVIRDFKFGTGETLPALTQHYRTLGAPKRDASGVVRNAVLILHGTGGTGAG